MTDKRGAPPLDGELKEVPFAGASLKVGTREAYRTLRDRPDVNSILVVTRATGLIETVEEWLDEVDLHSNVQVTVQSLTQHASRVRTATEEGRQVATRAEQMAAIVAEMRATDWDDSQFLREASQQESFFTDISALVTAILTQDVRPSDIDDADLRAISEFAFRVRDRLEAAGRTDLSRVIHVANRALDSGVDVSIPDAVLVVNFEEFADREREYVARISEERDLICVAQEASSVYRVSEEPGDPTQEKGLTSIEKTDNVALQSQPEIVAARLGTGDSHAAGDLDGPGSAGSVSLLQGETFETHVRGIADEIHRLNTSTGRSASDVGYGDIAVVVRDTRVPISDIVQQLWNQNIPVSSTSVSGLEYDSAARELYHVLRAVVALRGGREVPRASQRALETRIKEVTLEATETGSGDIDVRETLADIAEQTRYDTALAQWIDKTELKGRIAASNERIQARISFDNVEEVIHLSRFVQDQGLCQTWEEYLDLIELFYERETSDRLSDALETSTDGVRVDTVRALKGDRRKAVFVVGVVEDEFPEEIPTNPLFPEGRARGIDEFPLFVDPSVQQVRDTFPTTADAEIYDPIRAYYREMDRRLLAIASQTTEDHLYFGTYRQDRTGLAQYRPSRYLDLVEEEVELERMLGDDDAKSPEREVVAAFDESQRDLWEATLEEPIDEQVLIDRFRNVQSILASQDDTRIREALRTRIELSRGEIRRSDASTEGANR